MTYRLRQKVPAQLYHQPCDTNLNKSWKFSPTMRTSDIQRLFWKISDRFKTLAGLSRPILKTFARIEPPKVNSAFWALRPHAILDKIKMNIRISMLEELIKRLELISISTSISSLDERFEILLEPVFEERFRSQEISSVSETQVKVSAKSQPCLCRRKMTPAPLSQTHTSECQFLPTFSMVVDIPSACCDDKL